MNPNTPSLWEWRVLMRDGSTRRVMRLDAPRINASLSERTTASAIAMGDLAGYAATMQWPVLEIVSTDERAVRAGGAR